MRDAVVVTLIGLGVASTLLCCLGLLAARTLYDRLHYVSAASGLPPALIAAAVVVDAGLWPRGLQAVLVALLLLLAGSVTTHATARAALEDES